MGKIDGLNIYNTPTNKCGKIAIMDKINPYYITGFVEGEGSFYVGVLPRAKNNSKWEIRPSFSLSQNIRSANLVYLMKDFFCCGTIRVSKRDNTLKYEVRDLISLNQTILPHFCKYPLKGEKQKDFEAFEKIIFIMNEKRHLDKNGVREIAKIARSMSRNPKRIKFLDHATTLLKE